MMKAWLVLVIVVSVVSVVSVVEGALYGLSPLVPQLVEIDPTTGTATPVGTARLPSEYTGQQLSSIDAVNSIYYMVAFNETSRRVQLVGLSLSTGKLVRSVTLPFAPQDFAGIGQSCNVIPANGDVLVSGRDGVRNLHQILRVTPSTGYIALITSVADLDVLGGASSFDPVNNILWLQLGVQQTIYLFGFNIITKQQVYQLRDTLNMETMNYDPVSQLLYGVGLQVTNQSDYTRILMTLDSKTGQFNVIGNIPGYFVIYSGVGALNPTAREVYCYLQKVGSTNQPMQLLTLDMADASIKSNPVGCVNPNKCPWSMAYLDKN